MYEQRGVSHLQNITILIPESASAPSNWPRSCSVCLHAQRVSTPFLPSETQLKHTHMNKKVDQKFDFEERRYFDQKKRNLKRKTQVS